MDFSSPKMSINAAAVAQANHPHAVPPSFSPMMSPFTSLPSISSSPTTSSPATIGSLPLQRKLDQLRFAAWENDLTVIKDVLQSLEDEGDDDDASYDENASMGMSTDNNQQAARNGFGPLHYAASLGNLEMLHSILAANVCDVDELDKDGNTALLWAVWYVSTPSGAPAPYAAAAAGSFGSPSFADTDAGKRTELELIEALIDSGANVNKANFEGETPLSAAVKLGCVEKVALLLENGADPNVKDIDGATCLHYAASLGLETIVALLLRNGAFLNCTDEWDECALHWAVREGGESAVRIVKLLAEHGAVLDLSNEDGETPLDLAVETGDDRMVQALLSLGAMGSGFDSMSIADESFVSDRAAGMRQYQASPLAFDHKAAPNLLAWSTEASRVMRACEQSLTHLAA